VPQVPFLDGFEEKYAFVDLTQLYLDPPVLDAVDFLIGHGQAELEGAVVADRQVVKQGVGLHSRDGRRRAV
jgi:hypothetical protein